MSIRSARLTRGRVPRSRSTHRRWVSTPSNAARRRRRRIRLGLSLVLGGILVGAGLEAVTLALALGDLNHGVVELTDATAALGTNPDLWTAERIANAEGLGTEAEVSIRSADNRLGRDPVLGGLSHLLGIGDPPTALLDPSDTP